MVNLIKVIILGIVEGITEWLPVSSTGHLILVENLLHLNARPDFITMFEVVIQLGAILAVCVLYFNKLNPFSRKKSEIQKKNTWILWVKVFIATVPAAVLGVLFDDAIDKVMGKPIIISIVLIVFGVLFIVVENLTAGNEPRVKKLSEIDYKLALFIGLFQVIAMLLPGTSRSGITIVGGLLLGMARPVIAEFTFFMAIPVMFGASLLKLVKFGMVFTGGELGLLVAGFITAFIVSLYVIRFFIRYIKRKDFKAFGYYRIVIGMLAFLYFLLWA